MAASAVNEKKLRSVRYKCVGCDQVHKMRFALSFIPYRRWLMTCPLCGKYTAHHTIERGALTQADKWR
jgi:ribosomal protein L44E